METTTSESSSVRKAVVVERVIEYSDIWEDTEFRAFENDKKSFFLKGVEPLYQNQLLLIQLTTESVPEDTSGKETTYFEDEYYWEIVKEDE